MTDEELKELVASLAISQKETDRQLQQVGLEIRELRESQKDTDRQLQQVGLEIRELHDAQKETDRQQKETDRQLKETDRQQKETNRQLKETDRQLRKQLKELGKQIGGLGNKFGRFTEGQAFPAMRKILRQKFKMENILQRVESSAFDEDQEIDVLAYNNGARNEAIVVEVKSFLGERDLAQVLNILEKFPRAFPEHANKKLYGIVAYVDATDKTAPQKVLDAGLYLACIHDEHFRLTIPRNFKPKQFNPLLTSHKLNGTV